MVSEGRTVSIKGREKMGLPPPQRSGPGEEVEGEEREEVTLTEVTGVRKWTLSNLLFSFVQFIIQGYFFGTLQIPSRFLSPVQKIDRNVFFSASLICLQPQFMRLYILVLPTSTYVLVKCKEPPKGSTTGWISDQGINRVKGRYFMEMKPRNSENIRLSFFIFIFIFN